MAAHVATDFFLIDASPGAASANNGVAADRTLQGLIDNLKQANGIDRVYFGQQLEKPEVSVVAAVWTSSAAADAFAAQGLVGAARRRAELAPAEAALAVLKAPTTEVFTGYAAEDGFGDGVGDFARRVDAEAPEGYRGAAVGEVEGPGVEGRTPAVALVVGWDSREAHVRAKERPGAIRDNIGLLRVKRKEADMWHASFREQ